MKYLILLAFILVGCSESKPESRLWEIKNECRELAQLIEAETIQMFDTEEGKPVCRLSKAKDYVYNFYDQEASGAVRGIKLIKNKDLVPALEACLEENECSKFKFEHYISCYRKCQDKVGWTD